MTASILFDTNVIGECGRSDGDPAIREWVKHVDLETVRISAISWGELAFGVAKMAEGRRRSVLAEWLVMLRTEFAARTLVLDTAAATIWGELRAQLRAAGTDRPGLDMQIAAIARRHGLAVATRNIRNFAGLGIDLIDPWAVIGRQGGRNEQGS